MDNENSVNYYTCNYVQNLKGANMMKRSENETLRKEVGEDQEAVENVQSNIQRMLT